MSADFKRAPRIRDAKATVRAVELFPYCAACGGRAETGDHVIRRGQGGDDLVENIVTLCGHGTAGCHGAKHGSPYEVRVRSDDQPPPMIPGDAPRPMPDTWVERRTAEWVAERVGKTLLKERRDVLWYVMRKLGYVQGLDFLERTYGLDPNHVRYLPGSPA